jgi:hypothetical protein
MVGYSIRTLNELFNIHICFLLDFSEKLFLKIELLIRSEKTLNITKCSSNYVDVSGRRIQGKIVDSAIWGTIRVMI